MNLVLDTSAAAAILFNEPERYAFDALIFASEPCMSAGSLVELIRVAARHKPRTVSPVWGFLDLFAVEVIPVDLAQIRLAEEGHLRFGKGRGAPPAVLNFGDLFAYALARHLDVPLLFKGNDFRRTDIRVAL